MLRGDEKFAGEGRLGGATVQGFFGGNPSGVYIVILFRQMGEDEIAGASVKSIRIGEEFADCMVGEVSVTGKNALLDDPRIRPNLKHLHVVVRLQNETITSAKMDLDELRHIAQVGTDCHLCAISAKSERDGIGGIVRNHKSINIDVPDTKMLATRNRFDAAETLTESVREDALESGHCWFGDVQRGSPHAQDLREAIAMVSVLVSD